MLLDHAKMKHIFKSISMLNAGIVERDGLTGLYRGFVPNALKNLPNSRYILLHTMVTKIFGLVLVKLGMNFFCLTTHSVLSYCCNHAALK
jgi:hypothetical protein